VPMRMHHVRVWPFISNCILVIYIDFLFLLYTIILPINQSNIYIYIIIIIIYTWYVVMLYIYTIHEYLSI